MKAWLRKIVVLILLGAVLNTAVAWGIAALGDPYGGERKFAYRMPQTGDDFIAARCKVTSSAQQSGQRVCTMLDGLLENRGGRVSFRGHLLIPDWGRDFLLGVTIEELTCTPDLFRHSRIADCRGWPMPAYWGGMYQDIVYSSGGGFAVHLRPARSISIHSSRKAHPWSVPAFIPLIPMWPGFAINTIFYAAISWMMLVVPCVLRRKRRMARGLCIHCAYDLRGAPADSRNCPECGALRTGGGGGHG